MQLHIVVFRNPMSPIYNEVIEALGLRLVKLNVKGHQNSFTLFRQQHGANQPKRITLVFFSVLIHRQKKDEVFPSRYTLRSSYFKDV